MTKKSVTVAGIMIFIVALSGLVAGCKSGANKSAGNEINIAVNEDDKTMGEIKQARRIFNALPSPLESAMLVKSSGTKFNPSLMNPVSNASNYATSRSMALNLGIYTCDLSFASLYEQTQMIIDYMNAAKKMADGLGILKAIDESTIDRLEQNINNSEVIMEITSETFMNSSSFLEENGQYANAALTLAGGWFEGLYISTQLVNMNDFKGNKLVGRIIDQKLSIDILLDLLKSNAGDKAIDDLIIQVNKLKAVFDKVNISNTPLTAEVDKATNTTVLKSEATTSMTPEVFKELAATVAEIRNTFVK